MSKEHIDSSLSDFLKEEGVFEEAQNQAIKEVAARSSLRLEGKEDSEEPMAKLLKASRTQVDRPLVAKSDIALSSLQRAAAMVGRRVMIQLV